MPLYCYSLFHVTHPNAGDMRKWREVHCQDSPATGTAATTAASLEQSRMVLFRLIKP